MSRNDVMRLAREAGLHVTADGEIGPNYLGSVSEGYLRFAELVAAAEREGCANVCEEQASEPECPERAAYCAAAIRARGSKP